MSGDSFKAAPEPFQREERFIVIKRNHLSKAKEEALRTYLYDDSIGTVECVVVESDWPEYETVWRMIEDRVTGRASTDAAPVAGEERFAELSRAINAVIGDLGQVNSEGYYNGVVHESDVQHLEQCLAALAHPPVPDAAGEACPTPTAEDETYYSKGKDAPWYEALSDADFAREITSAAQDLNDTGLGDDLDKWMPFQAMMSIAGERLQKQTSALIYIRSELAIFAACCAVSNKVNDTFVGTEAKAKEWVAYINDALATGNGGEGRS